MAWTFSFARFEMEGFSLTFLMFSPPMATKNRLSATNNGQPVIFLLSAVLLPAPFSDVPDQLQRKRVLIW